MTDPDRRRLDDLSVEELEELLAEAEITLSDVRAQLRAERAKQHAALDRAVPPTDLTEVRGRWTHFRDYLRHLTDRGEGTGQPARTDQPQDGR